MRVRSRRRARNVRTARNRTRGMKRRRILELRSWEMRVEDLW